MTRQTILLAVTCAALPGTTALTQTAPTDKPAAPLVTLLPAPLPAALATHKPVFTVYLRERGNATQYFGAVPDAETYGHGDSLLRMSLAQRLARFDYQLEMSNSSELELPHDAVSPVTAQGQLGLGGIYYAANNSNPYPAAISFKTGYLRYHFKQRDANTLQVGRFEFLDGAETTPKNTTLTWLQTNRIAQRLIGNFGFSNGQRSFDGVQAKFGGDNWDVTAMGARAVGGVFNMNANKELDTDAQYVAYSRYVAKQRVLFRGFALGYHDGRPNITKTDNRAMAVRAADHRNIRLGSFGGDMIAALPVGKETFDLLVWGVGQTGQWGALDHKAGAFAVEGGLRLDTVATKPWLRGGFLRSTGDDNPNDGRHGTYFQVLTTPRNYARYPFFNMMNSTDGFVQLIDKPSPRVEVRTDLHFLQLTNKNDLYYQGGGSYDGKVFGYTGRPSNGHTSLASLYDISADFAVTKQVAMTAYYAHAFGKSVIASIYPAQHDSNYGYIELTYKLSRPLGR